MAVPESTATLDKKLTGLPDRNTEQK